MAETVITELKKGVFLIQAKAPEPLTTSNNKSKKIITYGSKNNYPQELLRAINKSSYASACLRTFASYLYGEGLKADRETNFSKKLLSGILTPDFVQKICYDYAQFRGFSIQCRFNASGNISDSLTQKGLIHIDFSTARLGNYEEDTFEVRTAWLSQDWEQPNKKEFKPQEYPLFDIIKAKETIDQVKQDPKYTFNGQIYYAKQYKSGEPFYPTPAWSSALNWIYADGEISAFHANNIDNGFFPSVIIYHPGISRGDVAEDGRPMTEVINENLEQFQSAENAGKIFNITGETKDQAPEVIQVSANNNADLFNTLGEIIDKKIVAAFQMPKLLAGIETPGSLGSTNEIANSIEFYYSVITPDIKYIENELNTIIKYIEGWDGTKVTFVKAKPINYIDPAFIKYLDESEIRLALGYPEKRPSQLQLPV